MQFHSTGPLSLISVQFSERKEPVKGARIVRGLRTLDRFFPFGNMDAEGKGAGGLRGLAPWRSMRQRLMRAVRRAASSATHKFCYTTIFPMRFTTKSSWTALDY